jgi:ATP-dependent DNA helicase RecQ
VTAAATSVELLRRVFGHADFHGAQREIVEHVVGGGDALVLMPTGGGKSLCYQLPALLGPGTAVVVSPLIALMQDQVAALAQLGVRAEFLNSTLDLTTARAVEGALLAGEIDLLYVAPERLVTPRCLELLDRSRVALFAIDEAHCVSQWGHDFRPEYLGLSVLHERYPGVPRIALTATADPQTRREIVERLALDDARVFVSSFDRPNIRYTITDKRDARTQLLRFVREHHPGDAGIVYCLSRRRVEETAAWLQGQGISALAYHAGLDAALRSVRQARFQREDGVVMVATIAFGMGIDKPDVRFVAHLDLPKSIEGYYQETGRAGRDGRPADAWMVYGLGDVVQQRRLIEASEAGGEHKRIANAKLDALLGLCETAQCRRVRLLAYFGEVGAPCGNCDTCLAPPETWDATIAAQKALSAIYRTGQRFGAVHVVDVLRGKETERVLRLRHQQLGVFGLGADLDEMAWRDVIRQLVVLGLVEVDHAAFGALRLTPASRAVLKGEQRVELRRAARRERQRHGRALRDRSSGAGQGAVNDGDAQGANEAGAAADHAGESRRYARLKAWRLEEARRQSVPAYVILHDATLAEVARRRPRELATLAAIPGIGAHKLERYGRAVLGVVDDAGD